MATTGRVITEHAIKQMTIRIFLEEKESAMKHRFRSFWQMGISHL